MGLLWEHSNSILIMILVVVLSNVSAGILFPIYQFKALQIVQDNLGTASGLLSFSYFNCKGSIWNNWGVLNQFL